MEPELIKDIIVLFLIAIGSNLHTHWAILYPYIGSYLKHHDSSITLVQVFSALLLAYIGNFIGNLILPKIFFVLGIKRTIQLGSILTLANCISFYMFTHIMLFYINMVIVGILAQFTNFSVTFYFSEKYENGVFYVPYVNLGIAANSFIWPFVMTIVINPNNRGMDEITYVNGFKEIYYSYDVSQRIVKCLNIYGLYVAIANVLLSQFLINPKTMKSRVSLWIKSRFQGDRKSIKILNDDFKVFVRKTTMNLNESYRNTTRRLTMNRVTKPINSELIERNSSTSRIN